MNDLYHQIVSQRGTMEKVLSRLPGFRGYMEMNTRRQADRMVRDQVVSQLRQQLNRLTTIESALVDAGGLAFMSKTRSAKTKFQTYIDRIATDNPGYSGFYDAIKIDEHDLQVVYSFDLSLLDYVEKFKEKLDALQKAGSAKEALDPAIQDLDALTLEANEAYSLRDNVLTGIK